MRRKYGFCAGLQLHDVPCLRRPTDIVDHPICQTDITENSRVQGA